MNQGNSSASKKFKLFAGVAWGVLTLTGTAYAQDAATSAKTGAPAASNLDIIVTARKREESLSKVPIAVTVLSAEILQRENIVNPQDLSARVPSLSVGSATTTRDSSKYSIRGQGQAFAGADPAVAIYFAEVPTNGTGPGHLYDLQNVQVLKGPQGTLFGKNTTGGAVLLQPTRPGQEIGGYVNLSAGDFGMTRVQGAVDLPLVSDKILTRFAIDVNKRDGFSKDVVTGQDYDDRDYQAYRASLILRPFVGFENYTVFDYAKSDTHQSGVVMTYLNPTGGLVLALGAPPPFGPGIDILSLYNAQQARGIRNVSSDVFPDYQKIKSWGVSNISTYELNDAITLKNVFGYREFTYATTTDVDGLPVPIVQAIANPFNGSGASSDPSSKTYSDELQIQGKAFDGRLDWITGLYYAKTEPESDTNKDIYNQFFIPQVIQSLRNDETKAIFGQATYAVTPKLKFTGGLRYTEDERKQEASNYIFAAGPVAGCTFPVAVPNCVARSEAKFDATTWTASLDYQVTDDTLVYVTARRGYKSGAFNAASPSVTDRVFKPEFVTDVELGVKSQFEIGGMPGRVSADIYRGEFEDIQLNGVIFDAGSGQLLTLTQNAGKGVIQGVELEGLIKPITGVTLSGFYSYIDASYDELVFGGLSLPDRPFFNVPEQKFGVTAEYDASLGDDIGTLSLSASYTYQTEVFFNEPFEPTITNPNAGQDDYGLLNLRAGLNNIGGAPVDISVFATNVTDEEYKIFEFDAPSLFGYSAAIYGEPRMYGIELSYRFGADATK